MGDKTTNLVPNMVPALRAVLICIVTLGVGWVLLASAGAAQQAADAIPTLPARVEAEAYDAGVEGIDFSDTDEAFGSYRLDDPVDAFSIDNAGASNGSLLGRTRDGEFVQYTLNIDEATELDVRLRVASGATDPGVIHVDIDGDRLGTVDGDTERWFDWVVRSAGTTTLEPGTHTVRLTWAEGANVNFDWIDFVSTAPQLPTCSAETIEAEAATVAGRFQIGNDTDASGGQYVAVPRGSGGWWRGASDNYVEFCVGVTTAGQYRIDARVQAVSAKKRSFYVAVDDGPVVEFVVAAPTIGAWQTASVNDAGALDPLRPTDPLAAIVDPTLWDLDPGDHIVRFYLRRDGSRLDSITLRDAAEAQPTPTPTPPPTPTPAPTPTPTPPPAQPDCPDCEVVRQLFVETGQTLPTGDAGICTSRQVACNSENTAVVGLSLGGRAVETAIGDLAALSSLTRLSLDQISTLAPEIGDLTGLTYLELFGTELTSVPPEIGNLTNLETFVLQEAYELTELPPEIGNLTNLREFYVIENWELISLPPETGNLTNLTRLSVELNFELASLPAEIGNLTNLTYLSIDYNHYRFNGLAPDMTNLTNLTNLSLLHTNLTELPRGIGELTNLTRLDLRENSFEGDITALAPLVESGATTILIYGNNCLTTTDEALAAYFTATTARWDQCDNP